MILIILVTMNAAVLLIGLAAIGVGLSVVAQERKLFQLVSTTARDHERRLLMLEGWTEDAASRRVDYERR